MPTRRQGLFKSDAMQAMGVWQIGRKCICDVIYSMAYHRTVACSMVVISVTAAWCFGQVAVTDVTTMLDAIHRLSRCHVL